TPAFRAYRGAARSSSEFACIPRRPCGSLSSHRDFLVRKPDPRSFFMGRDRIGLKPVPDKLYASSIF
ncbi:MAG: hypothetical protein IKQ36_05180, partial [Clostridia bacterium]|nr:hypothetical protein [Clostridia bacterium]